MPFQKASRHLLVDEIVNQFFESLSNEELTAGQKVASERDLAERFGVSRPVVREAIKTLRARGVVEVRPGNGTFIVDNVAEALTRWNVSNIKVGSNPVLQVFELREAMEPYMAQTAALRRNEENLRCIYSAVEKMQQMIRTGGSFEFEAFAAADRQFHLSVAQATQNPSMAEVLESVSSTLAEGMRLSGIFDVAWYKACEFHTRIAEAIEKRDPDLAGHEMNKHLSDVREDLNRAMGLKADFPQSEMRARMS